MAEPAHGGRFYTVQELARHDGTDASLPLLLSVQGIVFDVSSARDFYGPGALPHALVGDRRHGGVAVDLARACTLPCVLPGRTIDESALTHLGVTECCRYSTATLCRSHALPAVLIARPAPDRRTHDELGSAAPNGRQRQRL